MKESVLRYAEKGGVKIKYFLTYKRVKRLRLRIKCGEVYLSSPRGIPLGELDGFVIKYSSFIDSAKEKQLKRGGNVFSDEIAYLGKMYKLIFSLSAREYVSVSDGEICFFVKKLSCEYKEKTYNKWLKSECVRVYGELLKKYYPFFSSYAKALPSLSVRNASTRWGSCNPQKNIIMLSARLLARDIAAIEYVVVHEYSHYVKMDHSAAFYKEVASVLPDWKERKKLLYSDLR